MTESDFSWILYRSMYTAVMTNEWDRIAPGGVADMTAGQLFLFATIGDQP